MKPIASLQVDLQGGRTTWIPFDPPESGADTVKTVTQQFDGTNSNVQQAFGLDDTPDRLPFGRWNEFIDHCRSYGPFVSAATAKVMAA